MTSRATRVLIVTDHDVMHAGLTAVLTDHPGIDLLEGRSPELALHGAEVVLYDVIGLHEGDGVDLQRLVKESDVAVLAVTRDLRPDLADRALEKGVDGCVSSDATAAELLAAVEAAAWGDLHGDGEGGTVDWTVNPATGATDVSLTARESDIIARITAGMANGDIAADLYLSINSIKTYIRSAYRKIGISSRSQAVAWGIQHGYPPPTAFGATDHQS